MVTFVHFNSPPKCSLSFSLFSAVMIESKFCAVYNTTTEEISILFTLFSGLITKKNKLHKYSIYKSVN